VRNEEEIPISERGVGVAAEKERKITRGERVKIKIGKVNHLVKVK
jgi:hypothetical protein